MGLPVPDYPDYTIETEIKDEKKEEVKEEKVDAPEVVKEEVKETKKENKNGNILLCNNIYNRYFFWKLFYFSSIQNSTKRRYIN